MRDVGDLAGGGGDVVGACAEGEGGEGLGGGCGAGGGLDLAV